MDATVSSNGTTNRRDPQGRSNAAVRRLLVIYSPDPQLDGHARILTGPESIELGRLGAELALAPSDRSLSRAHCLIRGDEAGGYWVQDLGSSNGTWVNRERVQRRELQEADVLRIGDHLLLYQSLKPSEVQAMLNRETDGLPMVGQSPQLASVRQRVRAVGAHAVPVLIFGETGTGKDVVARALHAAYSAGSEKPFVAINCAALVESLAESTLFGHRRGAFSGADADRAGAFRKAHGGTLFLDELGDLPLTIQAKLLRALECGEVSPVGMDSTVKVDTRIIAATNKDLELAQGQGEFRSDLFNRLAVHVLRLRPLRERRDDILPLFRHFLGLALSVPAPRLTPGAAELLVCHDWKNSNVRGVRALVQAIATSGTSAPEALTAELVEQLLHPEQEGSITSKVPLESVRALLEIDRDKPPRCKEDLARVLQAYEFNVSRTAKFFNTSRKTVYNWCDRFEVVRPE